MKKLLYYAPVTYGGLLIYSQEQADALAGLGIAVDVLCPPDFKKRPGDRYAIKPLLANPKAGEGGNRVMRILGFYRRLTHNLDILRREITRGGYNHVFFVSYAEYFAPLWVGAFRRLARRGVIFGSMVQEPVRNFQVGPRWWHRWSVASAYSFLKCAFVHEDMPLDTVRPMPHLKVGVVPMAPHVHPNSSETKQEVRARLGIPPDAVVLFAFGHIRDNKNLDYAVMALREIPNAHLLVAGSSNASSQKPKRFYRELAERLGVANRCTWFIDYVSNEAAANYFEASDLILLTYGSSFHSASSVLNVAARYRKPCVASAGEGSLKSVVNKYDLGIWVEPDDPATVAHGIAEWIQNPPTPRWAEYMKDNSWQRNAEIIAANMGLIPS
jgi:glycosyltransferase involved in cell wall biosynthesis